MLHEVGREGSHYESTSDTAIVVKEMLRLQSIIFDIICKRTGMTVVELRKRIGKKERWLSAKEAVEWNLVDGITDVQ